MEIWTAFILGLVGSVHCAGMCGPLALALPASASGSGRFMAGRLAYNLGRILTYCLLGTVFGLAGKTLFLAGLQRWVSIVLGVVLLTSVVAVRKLALWRPVTVLMGQLKAPMSQLLRRSSLGSLAILGLLNGLLPCGLVYVAGAGSLATGDIVAGAKYMAFFGFGTLPMMLAISLSGALVPIRLRLKLRGAIPVCVVALGVLLILRGMSLGISYLSPDLSTGGSPDCCHVRN
jgi:sulfite exporter TauE/SafE